MKTITNVLAILAVTTWIGSASAAHLSGSDIVTVNGTAWAQVDLFVDLTWDEVSEVCPAGICIGTLAANGNEYDMTGWIFATADDVNKLFNLYIGSESLGPGPDFYNPNAEIAGHDVSNLFFGDGWRTTIEDQNLYFALEGWTRTRDDLGNTYIGEVEQLHQGWAPFVRYDWDRLSTGRGALSEDGYYSTGYWFYESDVPIPIPSTLLLVIGALPLLWQRLRRPLHSLFDNS